MFRAVSFALGIAVSAAAGVATGVAIEQKQYGTSGYWVRPTIPA
jgi:hypothetical protein